MLKYEMKKIFNKRLNRILLSVALLLAIVFSIFALGSFKYLDSSGVTHTGFSAARSIATDKNQWKGELTPKKISQCVKISHNDWQATSDIIDVASEMFAGESGDSDDTESILHANAVQVASIYDIYSNNLRKMSREYGTSTQKRAFLTQQYGKVQTPFYYEAFDSWDTMLLYATTYSLVLIIIIGFLSAGIFSEEFQYKTDAVFFSTRYGRSKAVHTKIRAGLITATMVYAIGIALLSTICFGVMGVSGASVSYLLSEPYALYSVSFSEMYAIVVLGGYIASMLTASVSMLIASKTRTMSIAVGIPFVLFCVSPFIGRALPFRTFFSLTPDQLTNIVNCARIPYIYQIGNAVFRQIPVLIVFYALISIILLPMIYRNYHKLTV